MAQSLASSHGMGERLTYFVGDFNAPMRRSQRYDAIFFHQSLHHVWKLERLFFDTLRVLRRNGLVYLDEYVGPSRFEWTDENLALQRAAFQTIPAALRRVAELPPPIQEDDPSEAFRSSEIVPLLHRGFDIIERRDYGGTILSVLFPAVDFAHAPSDLVDDLIKTEQRLLAEGAPSFYTIIVARPKRGLRKWYAMSWYWLAPKLRRLKWEIRHRLRPDAAIPY
jgi:SAM-dependent methyltransferase